MLQSSLRLARLAANVTCVAARIELSHARATLNTESRCITHFGIS